MPFYAPFKSRQLLLHQNETIKHIAIIWLKQVAVDAWNYWWVCVPVVVVGAPFGALFIRNRSRHFVAGFLYCSITAQYAWALVVIPQSPQLLLFKMLVLAVATLFFWMLTRFGERHTALLRIQETTGLEGCSYDVGPNSFGQSCPHLDDRS